jgi:TPR repeat protein
LSIPATPAPLDDAQQTAIAPQKSADPNTLFAYTMTAAERGHRLSMLNTGIFYEQGVGIPKDYSRALEWYERAATNGVPDGVLKAANCYLIGMGTHTDVRKGIELLKKAADLGSAQAQYQLSGYYFRGQGVGQDIAKGLEYLEKAATGGVGMAANDLAIICLRGTMGQPEDPEKALAWFMMSADAGYLEGIKNLAVAKKDGLGGEPDPEEALKWYLVAKMGGFQASDLDKAIEDLKERVGDEAAMKADEEAVEWLRSKTASKGSGR